MFTQSSTFRPITRDTSKTIESKLALRKNLNSMISRRHNLSVKTKHDHRSRSSAVSPTNVSTKRKVINIVTHNRSDSLTPKAGDFKFNMSIGF